MDTMNLSEVAALLADSTRATMCVAMLDGRAWTVGELAKACKVAPSTASEHVEKLRGGDFVATVRQGRHSYVRLASPHVAELVERLAEHAERRPVHGLSASVRARRLAAARTCYDHLAGALGVAIRDGMAAKRLLDTSSGLSLTRAGRTVLRQLGVVAPETTRPMLRDCLDWTERREHLSGALPAALLGKALGDGWLERRPDRGIVVRPLAAQPLEMLGVDSDRFLTK
ncbi:ArsR/SmtB family transcription factor [Kibdelosporangium aridum]|uniref:ArsR/SmtB family transcription factor n=1 Tax=Kibdelosporangium aridum TaxID=2030 RepID=UPI000525AA1C